MIPFRCVMADPTWPAKDKLPGPRRGASKIYASQMSVEEVCDLQMPEPVGPDALLFLWRVAWAAEEALRVCRAWGFRPVSEFVWEKTSASGELRMGMGRYVRLAHETCIIATRGQGRLFIRDHGVPSVIRAARGAHSAKPDAAYALVERLCGGPRLELFARVERPGWSCWGDEIGRPMPFERKAVANG